jgi:SAM-dependent methyltransferase
MRKNENYRIFFENREAEALSLEPRRRGQLSQWLARAGPATGGRALDLGCWMGDFCKLLPPAWEKWGIDLERHPELPREVHFIKADIETGLPLKDRSFDLIFAGEVIEHLRATQVFLGRCFQVLKPGGRLILTTPNLACWLNLWRWFSLGQPFCVNSDAGQDGHVRYLAPKTLKTALKKAGFELLHLTSVGGVEFLRSPPALYKGIFKLFPLRGKALMALARRPQEEET